METTNLLASGGTYSTKLLEIFVVLGLILIFIFFCAYLLRKTSALGRNNHGQIKIISTFPLSTKEKLMIIEVAGKQLLLGVTAHSIQTLQSFDEPLSITREESGFNQQLKKFLSKGES